MKRLELTYSDFKRFLCFERMPHVLLKRCLRRNENAIKNLRLYLKNSFPSNFFSAKKFFFFTLCNTAVSLFAQTELSESFSANFTSYQQNNYNEKFFVHTDKTFYLPGESIWFKIYCVSEFSNALSSLSKIAYVEIINNENKALLQAKVKLENGTGNGSFILPSYISSGNYTIVAYTNWMKNFDPQFYYHQQITIVNPLKPLPYQEMKFKRTFNIQFFPEGGNLVEGVTSKIAFKASGEYNEAVNCSGSVIDTRNNVVATFHSLKFGMGSFSFKPLKGEVYSAIINFTDTTFKIQLPDVYNEGYVMQLQNMDESHIKINVSINISTTGNDLYLLVHSRNVLKDFQHNNFKGKESVFIIDKNKLADGISQITVFNSAKQPVCERLYFKQPQTNLKILPKTDQLSYNSRKPVTLLLDVSEKGNKPVFADMSLSVFMIDSLQHAQYADIQSYLLLSSELKGNISSPEYYFQNTKEAEEAADNLVLTQGWRRFKWENILQNKKPYFKFLPEHEGILVTGKISGKNNILPANNVTAYLTVPGENFQLSVAKCNANGELIFNVKDFYSRNNIIVKTDSNYNIQIASSFADSFYSSTTGFKMPLQWKQQLLLRSINMQADNAYLANEKQRSYVYKENDSSLFYGRPDQRYYLDNYTRFITMEEVMREYVTAFVRLRKDAQQFNLNVYNAIDKTFFNDNPLVLIDGLPVFDVNQVIQFDPLKIKRLDVVSRKYYLGDFTTNGIVSYTTYNGDLADFPLNEGEVVVEFEGLQKQREFYSPVYLTKEQTENRIPDVRNVLYWSPEIKTTANGKAQVTFYTSDVTGKFACVVQGISKDGLAGSNMITFDVVK